jgi:hypothetical protein
MQTTRRTSLGAECGYINANESAYIFGGIVWLYQEKDKHDNFKVAPNI